MLKIFYKTIAIVRQFDLAFFSTPKDYLDYVNSYDEGERQANLEQSFRILFQLNQICLARSLLFDCSLFLADRRDSVTSFLAGRSDPYLYRCDAVAYGETLF